MTLTASHPDRWLYGGILVWIEWTGPTTDLPFWDGRSRTVRAGDRVLTLRRSGSLLPVAVEQKAAAA